MSAAPEPPQPPQGFAVVRGGRGYRTDQVDRQLAVLGEDRDAAWERAARLTVLAKRMEAEAAALRDRVAALGPQSYESLGRRAQTLYALAVEEADAVRAGAHEEAAGVRDSADTAGRLARESAREYAETLRADAEARAQQLLLAARTTADEHLDEARSEAHERRAEAADALREVRERTGAALAEQAHEHTGRGEALDREVAAREAELDARHAELTAHAEAALAEAGRACAEAQESARHGQEDAEARGAELVAAARVRAERIGRDTEGVLREHAEAREETVAHMAHVRSSLAGLTGRAPAEG
ncbi:MULTISPECIES: cellulose-binding protein [unclassified Streptomyces]|uniref:Cellulose-binding protein n=1 Tax=Streptomyces sp. NBC_00060 TaxID=2975636 RepID=A0AAU2H4R8_9ACTN